MARRRLTALIAGVVTATLLSAPARAVVEGSTSAGAAPKLYKNCTNLNKKYPHGIGRVGARDKTSGDPVTTFKRSNKLYKLAMTYNKGLDRDKDGIACEQE